VIFSSRGKSVRKVIIALATMALLMAPAHAQLRGKGSKRSEGNQQFDEQKKKNSAAEKAYKDALRRIPDQKVSDPWSTVR
jgi:hypothetical protein